MRVTLDDVELSVSEGIIDEGKRSVYEAARRSALSKNRVIVDIVVDGESIQDEDAFFSLSGGFDVRFRSQPIIDLVRESVTEGLRYIPALSKGLEGIATMLEENREQDAGVSLSQALEGLNWLVSVFDRSCGLLGMSADSFVSGNLTGDSVELNKVLEEMAGIMESGRSMRLAYVIRERLLPVVGKFAGYWHEIASQLERPLQ
jgi:hypothetical protein